jgi:hypothetical protein
LPGGSVVIFKGRWDFINRGRDRLFDAILSSVRFLENHPAEARLADFIAISEPLAANMQAWIFTSTDVGRMNELNHDIKEILEKHHVRRYYRFFP